MTYKEFIEKERKEWIGKTVKYEEKDYQVVDVDYNGSLLINKPTYYCESYTSPTTAVSSTMVIVNE